MKITKFVHSCLLVEMPKPVSRTVLFDPGEMSQEALGGHELVYLDDIVITHVHPDHFSLSLVKKLVGQFPDVRITAPAEVVTELAAENIDASSEPTEGMEFFDSPHESVEPLFPQPQQIGVHYLDSLTFPGDSHSFTASKQILALPVTAPWGATIKALNLALELKPQYVIPIHDWHYSEAARKGTYDNLEAAFGKVGITFIKAETAVPFVIDTSPDS